MATPGCTWAKYPWVPENHARLFYMSTAMLKAKYARMGRALHVLALARPAVLMLIAAPISAQLTRVQQAAAAEGDVARMDMYSTTTEPDVRAMRQKASAPQMISAAPAKPATQAHCRIHASMQEQTQTPRATAKATAMSATAQGRVGETTQSAMGISLPATAPVLGQDTTARDVLLVKPARTRYA